MSHPFGPMSFPAYRRIFIARGLSSAGGFMQIVAATWFAYTLSDSAAAVGILAVLALGPSIFGGPVGGRLLERFDARRLAIVLSLLTAIPPGLMAAMDFTGDLTLGWLYALVFVGAIPGSLNQPVISLIGPATVPVECRRSAVALMSMSYNVTRLLGATLGGFVVHWTGVGVAFAINAASFVIVGAAVAGTQLQSDAIRATGVRHRVATGGVQEIRTMQRVKVAGIAVAAFFLLVAPVEQLMPVVAKEHGLTAESVGLLLGAIGVGAMMANPIIGRVLAHMSHHRLMQMALLFAASGSVAMALTPNHGIAVDLFAAVLIGFGWEIVYVGGEFTVAVEVPSELRGRAMGLFFLLVSGSTAVGAVGLGLLHDWLGMKWTLLGTATATLLFAGYFGKMLDASRMRETVPTG